MTVRPDTEAVGGAPDYLPFEAGPFRMAMGLRPLAPADWIEVCPDRPAQMAEKHRLLAAHHAAVFQSLAGSEVAGREVLDLLADHLPRRFPALYARDGDRVVDRALDFAADLTAADAHPLDVAGRLVQEDLLLMEAEAGDGAYRLVAGSLCFPTRWRLADKLGRALAEIHAPVPFYADALARPVDRLFDKMVPGKGAWRLNWSVMDDPTLFQPQGHDRTARDPGITAGNAPDRLWLRVERQTLRKLPRTRAVLFTVRIHQRPFAALSGRPEVAARLAAALRALPPEMARYKSLAVFGEAALAWLDAEAAG